nr:MAG TPA: hypothetical protein [Caudoviricetes sp.]
MRPIQSQLLFYYFYNLLARIFFSLENHFKQFFQFFYHFNHPFPYYLSDYTIIPNLKNKYFSFHSHYSIAIVLFFRIKKSQLN